MKFISEITEFISQLISGTKKITFGIENVGCDKQYFARACVIIYKECLCVFALHPLSLSNLFVTISA